MQVITTHVNADFDCLAAMVAAGKLYPGARMVFSGSAERAVNDYLKETALPFKIHRVRDIDLEHVKRLILVDTQDAGRIGPFKALTEKAGVEVHIYDHHPESPAGVSASQSVIRKRGAATTLLHEILVEKQIPLSPEESTLLALGIFQDTASLLSSSTTAEDFSALARLVAGGANLNRVSNYLNRRLNQEQLNVLNDLIGGLETHNINGIDISLTTASMDHFVEDLAQVVHSVMDLEA
ncbi:MAG: DHH family phosphoesterase, partial [Nitrospinaceae bacterium]